MSFTVQNKSFYFQDQDLPCALGRGGLIAAEAKREGDGATPLGVWPFRRVYWRSDRLDKPQTDLPIDAIHPDDGWCDEPGDAGYNRLVRRPYPASCETMTREDELYDVVVVLGHNDNPPTPSAGSAIFLHCAKPGFPTTEGCVALQRSDLLRVLRAVKPGDVLTIME